MEEHLKNEQKRIESFLNSKNLSYEIDHIDSVSIDIRIDGDWRHDHIACVNAMNELGYTEVNNRIVEESDGDWYESVHTFFHGDRKMVEALRQLFSGKEQ